MDERDCNSDVISREKLIGEQEKYPELLLLSQKALSSEEEEKTPVCYFKQDGMLMRKWIPPDALLQEDWKVVHQIVIPSVYRKEVIGVAHDSPLSGHLGVNKTYNRILNHFFWPRLRQDVADYCRVLSYLSGCRKTKSEQS